MFVENYLIQYTSIVIFFCLPISYIEHTYINTYILILSLAFCIVNHKEYSNHSISNIFWQIVFNFDGIWWRRKSFFLFHFLEHFLSFSIDPFSIIVMELVFSFYYIWLYFFLCSNDFYVSYKCHIFIRITMTTISIILHQTIIPLWITIQ